MVQGVKVRFGTPHARFPTRLCSMLLKSGKLGSRARDIMWGRMGTQLYLQSVGWDGLGGLHMYHLSFYLFAAGAENTQCPRMGLRTGLRG